jgi:hypothetical protein
MEMKMLQDKTIWLWILALVLAAVLIVMGCGGSERTPAQAEQTPATEADSAPQVIDLANATCPVMGGRVAEGASFDWNGYRIHICCGGCENSFIQDPGRFMPALLQDGSIDPAVRDGLRQFCESQGIPVTSPDPASAE